MNYTKLFTWFRPLIVCILQSPVKHPGWSGTLKAFSVGNMSMQYSFLENKIVGSEDCLFLNIFVPLQVLL